MCPTYVLVFPARLFACPQKSAKNTKQREPRSLTHELSRKSAHDNAHRGVHKDACSRQIDSAHENVH